MQNIQIFCRGPVMSVVTYCWIIFFLKFDDDQPMSMKQMLEKETIKKISRKRKRKDKPHKGKGGRVVGWACYEDTIPYLCS